MYYYVSRHKRVYVLGLIGGAVACHLHLRKIPLEQLPHSNNACANIAKGEVCANLKQIQIDYLKPWRYLELVAKQIKAIHVLYRILK